MAETVLDASPEDWQLDNKTAPSSDLPDEPDAVEDEIEVDLSADDVLEVQSDQVLLRSVSQQQKKRQTHRETPGVHHRAQTTVLLPCDRAAAEQDEQGRQSRPGVEAR